jgi:phage shock protein PspC (stress-responsive transcriptional regulator)
MLSYVSATERSSSVGFEEMVKDFVATRPRRPRSGRVVAGVAAGIGRRYGIDPVIVRVALVVSAIYGGAGIICYLLGWLLLTEDGDEVSPFEALLNRGRSSTSKALTVVLCIAMLPATDFVFGGHYSTLAGMIVLGTGLFLLHRYRGDKGQITTAGTGQTQIRPEDSMPTSQFGDTTPADQNGPQDAVPNQPPAWDPLGAAPFAWDLPEPSPAPAPAPPVIPRPRRPRVALATIGVLFVTGAVLALTASSVGWLTPGHIAGILAAITGVGLLAGAFVHAGRGLIPLAVLLCVAAFSLASTHFDGWHGSGDMDISPRTIADVQPVYEHSAGDVTLDLRELPDTGTVNTRVQLGAGNLTVLVPPDAAVSATCSASAGHVDCLGQEDSGPGKPTVRASQAASDGSQLTINLDAVNGLGQVEVVSR